MTLFGPLYPCLTLGKITKNIEDGLFTLIYRATWPPKQTHVQVLSDIY